MEPIISIAGLTFRYPGADKDSLRAINLTIGRGEFVAIAGTNGSGKSTLCKTLNGLIPHYYVGDLEGSIHVAGLTAAEESVSSLSRKVAYVFQDFENQLVRPSVYDEVCFAPLNFGYPDYRDRGERALAMLGLSHLKDKWIWQLSGGQKHLTALAAALSLDPDIIIVDEPVAQLDPQRAKLVYEKLKMLRAQYGKTIIVIEHHTEFIADYCDRVVLMDSGSVRWVKPVREALSRVEELAELDILPPQVTLAAKRMLDAESARGGADVAATGSSAAKTGREMLEATAVGVPIAKVAHHEPAATVLDRGVASSLPYSDTGVSDEFAGEPDRYITRTAGLYPVTLNEAAALFKERGTSFEPGQTGAAHRREETPATPTVIFDGVSAGYKTISGTDHLVLRDLSLTLREGERIAIVGSNGAGKSSLLKLISGIRKPSSGTVTVCGFPTRKVSPEHLSDYVSYIYQQPEEMFIEDSIRKDIAYFLKARRRPDTDRVVDGLMARLNLTGLAERDGRLMSGGQQRRATLAIGLAMQPAVMLLDEPTASLDAASRREVTALLTGELNSVKTAVIATHDMQLVAEWASRVIVFHNGEIMLDTDKRSLFANAAVLETAGLTPPQITMLGETLGMEPPCLSVDEMIQRMKPHWKKEESAVGSH